MPTVLLLIGSVLCVAFYLYVYFAAESPRKGTLEWVELYEKPRMRRDILHKLKWTDILWCLLPLAFTVALQLIFVFLTAIEMGLAPYQLFRTIFLPHLVFEYTLPAIFAVICTYLTAKLLTGKTVFSLLPTLLLSCRVAVDPMAAGNITAACTAGSLLFLLLYMGNSGWKSWLCLVLSAALLASVTSTIPSMLLLALPWLGTVLAAEILRIKREDVSPWHLVLALFTGIVVLAAAAMACNIPTYLDLSAPSADRTLTDTDFFTFFRTRLVGGLQNVLTPFYFLTWHVQDLPILALLVAGIVLLADSVRRRRDAAALCLLLFAATALLLYNVYFPAAPIYPMAALVLAYMADRIRRRKFPGAAYTVACVPIVLTVFMTILKLVEV